MEITFVAVSIPIVICKNTLEGDSAPHSGWEPRNQLRLRRYIWLSLWPGHDGQTSFHLKAINKTSESPYPTEYSRHICQRYQKRASQTRHHSCTLGRCSKPPGPTPCWEAPPKPGSYNRIKVKELRDYLTKDYFPLSLVPSRVVSTSQHMCLETKGQICCV